MSDATVQVFKEEPIMIRIFEFIYRYDYYLRIERFIFDQKNMIYVSNVHEMGRVVSSVFFRSDFQYFLHFFSMRHVSEIFFSPHFF